jgi:hypothetical protein
MNGILQKWQARLRADRESIYFSEIMGHSGPFSTKTHMVFLSNRRLIFVEKGLFSTQITATFLSELQGLRLKSRVRIGLLLLGLFLMSMGGLFQLGYLTPPFNFDAQNIDPFGLPVTTIGVILLEVVGGLLVLLAWFFRQKWILLDVRNSMLPLTSPWASKEEEFLKLANDITYHRSLWEEPVTNEEAEKRNE